MHPPHLLLLGFGELNSKVAHQLSEQFKITAISRSPRAVPAGRHISLDLSRDALDPLPKSPDVILYCLTPGEFDEKSYRQVFLVALKRVTDFYLAHPPRHFIFVSSTSVYGQSQGEIVDEESVTSPMGHAGRVLVEAEQWLRQLPIATTSVRFSGIYGGHRTRLLEQIIAGLKSDQGPSSYTNRIHETDAARVLTHMVTLASQGQTLAPCYLASDDCPVMMHEVVGWIRQQLPCQPVQAGAEHQSLSRGGSKRCNNQLLKSTGFDFEYPDYKAGYGEMIHRWMENGIQL